MPITALSEGVIRALGSSQVLTTPVSVVKELVDNALDAGGRSIFVEISQNTLDIIQVKDNGHGIPPEDRKHVGKRYCTSKITGLEDLQALGGSFLGFRGEALASAVEMARRLEIVTRTEGELAAEKITFEDQGRLSRSQSASHAVGNTVRVLEFLRHLPVRKEACVKQAPKTLQKIKETLQAYAVARPRIRYSLKVLGGKNDKYNWSYAPKRDAMMADAALCIVGKDVTTQCMRYPLPVDPTAAEVSSPSHDGEDRFDSMDNQFEIEAYLPRPDADPSKISSKGQFVSIDSRPVSCSKGTLKQLITLYKQYIRSSLSDQASKNIKDPFLCLNVVCRRASYDANVEPAKDDVLFEEPAAFLEAVEKCFQKVYGELDKGRSEPIRKSTKRAERGNAFDLLLARRRPAGDSRHSVEQEALTSSAASREDSPRLVSGAQLAPERYFESGSLTASASALSGDESDDGLFVRPSSPSGQQRSWQLSMFEQDECMEDDAEEPARCSIPARSNHATGAALGLLSPIPSSGTLPASLAFPPTRPYVSQASRQGSLSPHRPITPPFSTPFYASSPVSSPYRNVRNEPIHDADQGHADPSEEMEAVLLPRVSTGQRDLFENGQHLATGFVSAGTLPLEGLLSQCDSNPRKPRSLSSVDQAGGVQGLNGSVIPSKASPKIWSDGGHPQRTKAKKLGGNQDIRDVLRLGMPQRPVGNVAEASASPNSSTSISKRQTILWDAEDLLDYERRKQLATKAKRDERTKSAGGIKFQHQRLNLTNSPHQNRYNAAVAALHQTKQADQPDKAPSSLAEADPRRYLLRMLKAGHDREGDVPKMRPSKLPLEVSPEDAWLQGVKRTISTSITIIEQEARKAISIDPYVREGTMMSPAFSHPEDMGHVQRRTEEVLCTAFRTEAGEVPTFSLNLRAKVEDHLRAYPHEQ